jgi:hypothetical protein
MTKKPVVRASASTGGTGIEAVRPRSLEHLQLMTQGQHFKLYIIRWNYKEGSVDRGRRPLRN